MGVQCTCWVTWSRACEVVKRAKTKSNRPLACSRVITRLPPYYGNRYVCDRQPLGKEAFRNSLPTTFMFKFFAALRATAQPALASVAEPYVRPVSSGTQAFKTVLPADHPGSSPTAKAEATEQASGETVFHDDIQVARPLYGALVMATQAPALVTGIDPAAALAMPGVVDFVSHEDIPGTNLCNPLGSDELLLVKIYDPAAATGTAEEVAKVRHESTVHFIGQAVGLVVAESRREAEAAARCIGVTYDGAGMVGHYSLQQALADPDCKPACDPAVNERGDVAAAFARPDVTIVEGEFSTGGQSHFCMEKHTTVCEPDESDSMNVWSSNQIQDGTRALIAGMLNKSPLHVKCITKRCGGAFGGKITKHMHVAGCAAVAAYKLGVAVKVQNNIQTDMIMGGNSRHPFTYKYKAAVENGSHTVVALQVDAALDSGCTTEWSGFIGGEILNHSEGNYKIANYKVTATIYNTNTPNNTFVRGPGMMQAISVSETIMDHMALHLGTDPAAFREKNMMTAADTSAHGLPLALCGFELPRMWAELKASSDMATRRPANTAVMWFEWVFFPVISLGGQAPHVL